jgi:hypothetical protein
VFFSLINKYGARGVDILEEDGGKKKSFEALAN